MQPVPIRGYCRVVVSGVKKMFVIKLLVFTISISILIFVGIAVEAEREQISRYKEYIEIVCAEKNVCPEFIEAVIEFESHWDPYAVNGDCIGLMQISEKYHRERMDRLGVTDLTDPYDNILVGVDYIAELFKKYEDPGMVLMLYNGDSRAKDYLETGKLSDYAAKVLERSAELEREHGK